VHGGLPDNEKSWRICHLVSIQHTNVHDKTDRRVDSAQRTTSPAPSTALLSTNDRIRPSYCRSESAGMSYTIAINTPLIQYH